MLSSLSRRRVVVLLILTSLLLITLDRRGNNVVIDKARQAFSVDHPPVRHRRRSACRSRSPTRGTASPTTTICKTENEALHDQIEHQKGAEIEAKTAINIANDLLKLNRLTSVRNYQGSRSPRSIGEAPSNFQNTVEITVGSRDGVAVGMPVTDGAGLIGKVTKVYPDQQRRDADHRSAVRRAGAGAQSGRRRRRIVDHVVDAHRTPRSAADRSTRPHRRARQRRRQPRHRAVDDHDDDRRSRRHAGPDHDVDSLDDDLDDAARVSKSDARPATSPGRAPIVRCCSASSTTRR